MRVLIQSNSDHNDLFKSLELLTNAAQLKPADIVINEGQNEITIPVRRRTYERKRSLLFGERYKLVSPEEIASRLTVKNVVDVQLIDNLHLPEVTLLFGVSVKNREIYFCSAEEQAGVTAFEVTIRVQSYHIELEDDLS